MLISCVVSAYYQTLAPKSLFYLLHESHNNFIVKIKQFFFPCWTNWYNSAKKNRFCHQFSCLIYHNQLSVLPSDTPFPFINSSVNNIDDSAVNVLGLAHKNSNSSMHFVLYQNNISIRRQRYLKSLLNILLRKSKKINHDREKTCNLNKSSIYCYC